MRFLKQYWAFGVLGCSISHMALAQVTSASSDQTPSSMAPNNSDTHFNSSDIVVTGTRVIANGNKAPTPVTVLPAAKLLEATPTTTGEALNILPMFAASTPARNIGSGASNSTGAYLNLRNFGAQRNLILLDGVRVPPTTADGRVDINVLPQALLQRIDIVTGGASAVYGSDAVTGVVNLVLDKKFNGLKGSIQRGGSSYGDNRNWKLAIAGGMKVFGDRGHLEVSYERYDSKGVDRAGLLKRPGVSRFPVVVGAGTTAAPFQLIQDGRQVAVHPGGLVNSPFNVPGLTDIYFPANGVPAPFVHGTPYFGTESGGSGSVLDASVLAAPLKSDTAFARFDYELTDGVKLFVQGSYSKNSTRYGYSVPYFYPGATVLSGNPYIPASIQSIMTANNIASIRVAKFLESDFYGASDTQSSNENISAKAGLEGKIFSDFDWSIAYSYGRNKDNTASLRNISAAKAAAALDAVVDPASGKTVCQVSLTAAANLFPGCLPLNVFGPRASDQNAVDWIQDKTFYVLTNQMHDVTASIAGSPFSLWAGPVELAGAFEYRRLSLENVSNAQPGVSADCTGLRPTANCTPFTLAHNNSGTSDLSVSQNVKEAAVEALIPLLKDQSFVQSLELNLAGRYTHYSTSGTVYTWKIGGNWTVNDDLRLRATRSRDIRAPSLFDLFAPGSLTNIPFNDIHTGVSSGTIVQTGGNPELSPEVAQTLTVGFVYQPSWLPHFSISLDYYKIEISNAITSAGTGIQFQRACEDSNGTSPYCELFIRPLPFTDKTPANFPMRVLQRGLNAAKQRTKGVDAEINYYFDLEDLFAKVPGRLGLRGLVSYQPVLSTQVVANLPATRSAGIAGTLGLVGGTAGLSKWRANLAVNFDLNGLNLLLVERWQSRQQPSDRRINVDLRPDIPAYAYTDLSFSYQSNFHGIELAPFVTVNNLFNKKPPITGYLPLNIGLGIPSPDGFDVFGRMITAGLRFKI